MSNNQTIGSIKIILLGIANIISNFLLKNGGMANGFETFVKGNISVNAFGTLEVRVNNNELSLNELSLLAAELENKLHEYLKQENFEETIFIKAIPLDWGVYTTKIVYEASLDI